MSLIGGKEYLNSFINESSTIVAKAGAELVNAAHLAVMFDANGEVVIADNGADAIGLILGSSPETIAKGSDVHILIKNIGLGVAMNNSIAKGQLVTVSSTGQIVSAGENEFIFGRALTEPTAAGQLIQVQINPMGYKVL